jgi:hypothetical protein
VLIKRVNVTHILIIYEEIDTNMSEIYM